jgi:putative FmdB family regulatory protein
MISAIFQGGGFQTVPIYEYKCTCCNEEFEVMQSFSDKPLKKCKKCGGKVKKLVSTSSFHLKGNGWYVTDYSRSGSAGTKPSPKKNVEPSSSPEHASPAKTPEKTESKKESKTAA